MECEQGQPVSEENQGSDTFAGSGVLVLRPTIR